MTGAHAGETATRALEIEWKFDAPLDAAIGQVAAALGSAYTLDPVTDVELVAVYLDTDDLALARRGVTLRRREGGHDAGWHLKVPAKSTNGGGARSGAAEPARERDEIMLPLSASATEPPTELLSLVSAWTLGDAVHPIARLTTLRGVHPIRDTDGGLVGEFADDRVTVHGPDRSTWEQPGICTFREWEVEARAGHVDACADVVALLGTVGATPSTVGSKLRKALSLTPGSKGLALQTSDQTPAISADAAGGRRKRTHQPSAGDTFAAYVARGASGLADQDHRVRLDLDDAVHQMRVELRRLRSAVRTCAPILHTDALADLRIELAWAADALGRERDLEVVQTRLERTARSLRAPGRPASDSGEPASGDLRSYEDAKQALDVVRAVLARERAVAHAQVVATMQEPRWTLLHAEVTALATDPPLRGRAAKPAAEVLPELVDRQWSSLAARADVLTPQSAEEDWHRVRINAKRTRYAAELASGALGADAKAFARRLKRVTELLGDLQDTALVRAELTRLIADGSPVLRPLDDDVDARSMFVLGRIHAAEERSADLLRAAFPALWEDVRSGRHRRWLKMRP